MGPNERENHKLDQNLRNNVVYHIIKDKGKKFLQNYSLGPKNKHFVENPFPLHKW